MEPGPDTEGSVSKPTEKQIMEQMSLTPDIKADLERLAAHSSNEEERKQAKAALKELEERTAAQAMSPGQRYLRARHNLPARSSAAENVKSGNDTAFDTVKQNLENVLNATRADRLARIDEGLNGEGTPPSASSDEGYIGNLGI